MKHRIEERRIFSRTAGQQAAGSQVADRRPGMSGKLPIIFERYLTGGVRTLNPAALGLAGDRDLSVILAALLVSAFLELLRLFDRHFL